MKSKLIKVLFIIAICFVSNGCETVKQAKSDYNNFRGTLIFYNGGFHPYHYSPQDYNAL